MERPRKRELRSLNSRAWDGDQTVFPTQSSLDSNLKKNTAFIKRLRTAITPAGVPTFLQEVRSLSLHKYLTEIVSACFEGICRLKTPSESAAGVEVVSALHQRFGPEDFTCYLGWLIGRGLSTPDKAQLKALSPEIREKEEKERLTRQRTLLRVATDLWLADVLRSLDDITRPDDAVRGKGADPAVKSRSGSRDNEPFPLEVLKDLLGHDREHVNLPLVVLFVKTFAWDILGSQSTKKVERQVDRKTNGTTEAYSSTDEEEIGAAIAQDDEPLVGPEMQQRFRNILLRYLDDVKAHLVRDQRHLAAQGRRNAEAYVKSGEVFEDRQSNHEKALKAQERLISSAQTLADVLGAEMPDLVEKESNTTGFDNGIGLVKTGEYLRGQGEGAGIWEDEDERRFYEKFIDLKDRVPGILLEDGKKKKSEEDDAGKTTAENKSSEDDASIAIANKTVGAQVDALLARLTELSNKDQVDQFAMDFCFLNSKASRNRLIKAMVDIPKGRTDLLPIYGRLAATLGKYLKDISQGLIDYLDEEFRSLQRRKSKDFLGQVRMVNIRYIAELTKFGVVPEHVIFHCLKVSLDDFSRMNIEIIASLLENCGRYLLRNPETSPRMASFLETLQRKKAAQHLGQQERMLVENAVYYVNPPERAAIQQKERTPLDLYIRKLVYVDLNKKTIEKITKQIRKLHWEEDEVVEYLRKVFIKPGKIKFSNVYLLAVMLGALYRHHGEFAVSVLDEILERITVGLETNDFRSNQRRISEVKYLGELYIYRMVDSALIFETLYKLLNYGHNPYPEPGKYCSWDLPDDFFRCRLVCALLETCGMYFEKGAAKKKLDFFLTYFQFYINVKDALPMDVEFVIQDTFDVLRPHWKLVLNDLNEATRLFAVAVAQNTESATAKTSIDEPEPEIEELDETINSDDERLIDDDGEGDDGESSEDEVNDARNHDLDSDEEEHIVVTRPEEHRDPEAEADFDRELAKLMAESVESRKFDRKPMFDVPLPMRRTIKETSPANYDSDEESRPQSPTTNGTNTMKFALLSKRGNRQQTRSIDLPSDSHFAVAMRTQQQAERAEQQRIKSLVLNYDLTSDDHENDAIDTMHGPPRTDKAGNTRSKQRARKLQLGDIDWT